MSFRLRMLFLMLAIIVVMIGASGCKTTESENLSERPWNSPKGWENGLPSGLNEGR